MEFKIESPIYGLGLAEKGCLGRERGNKKERMRETGERDYLSLHHIKHFFSVCFQNIILRVSKCMCAWVCVCVRESLFYEYENYNIIYCK